MKSLKFFAVFSMLAVLPAAADVEALYWQVTSEMSSPIEFTAAAFAAVDNNGNVTYLQDSLGSAWQAANSDKATTEAVASVLGEDYSTGWSFYIELMNQDSGGNWYNAGRIDNGGSNYSWSDVSSHVFSSSSMSMSLATPLKTGSANVPEPTSGVLLLIGGALLALRRRRS